MDIRNHLVDKLIEAILVKLDIEDIDLLFKVFSSRKIKNAWLKTMVVQRDYYYSLNRFYACLKSMITRHLSRLMA